MARLGYPAVATASASVAYSNGYNDGENIPFHDVLSLLKRITGSIDLPVTADIESGYASDDSQLQQNIKLLLDAGIVGINIEDSDKKANTLRSIDFQSNRIKLIRKAADESGIPLFINARTDVYVHEKNFAGDTAKLNEVITRGLAYKEAGADGFFPILAEQQDEITEIINRVELPVNIITVPGIPNPKTLHKMGVARISLGPSLLKIAVKAMKDLATQLKDHEGLSSITGNEITSDFLKSLVKK
jgi:2-methylisocitrate lyase-like PEP mutase family enzyme